jgi:hypothetical protein
MDRIRKFALVIGGYVAALLFGIAAVAIRSAFIDPAVAQASSGMYAFGDAILFVGIFGVVALVPTGGALFLLRPYRSFWIVLSVLGLAMAITGILAAIIFGIGRHEASSALATWAAFSVLRILIAPLFMLTFLVCAFFSPDRMTRIAFITATALEAVVSAYGGVVWFVPLLFSR